MSNGGEMLETTERQAKIAEIIQKREPIRKEIEDKQALLQQKAVVFLQFEEFLSQVQNNGPADVVEALKDIDFTDIREDIRQEAQNLEILKNRFSRPTLNIGVIGRARQGKSRLLQSLSGLTSQEIPDGDRESCTGVLCSVYHQSGINQTYGKVWF